MLWSPEAEWAGRVVVIVAGGASVTAADARLAGMARAAGFTRTIAVNDSVYPFWFADIAYATDAKWWRRHGGLPGFEGRRVTLHLPADRSEELDIDELEFSGTSGFDRDRRFIRHGGNSGYAALHLAAHLGAARIILLGYDLQGPHWFGEHPASIRTNRNPGMWINTYNEISSQLLELDIDVINASPASRLNAFRRQPLSEALADIGFQGF